MQNPKKTTAHTMGNTYRQLETLNPVYTWNEGDNAKIFFDFLIGTSTTTIIAAASAGFGYMGNGRLIVCCWLNDG